MKSLNLQADVISVDSNNNVVYINQNNLYTQTSVLPLPATDYSIFTFNPIYSIYAIADIQNTLIIASPTTILHNINNQSSVVYCEWSKDGMFLMYTSEDGTIKIINKNGMKRYSFTINSIVYSSHWLDDNTIVYANDNVVYVRNLSTNDISTINTPDTIHHLRLLNNSIVVTSDNRYRLYDLFGRILVSNTAPSNILQIATSYATLTLICRDTILFVDSLGSLTHSEFYQVPILKTAPLLKHSLVYLHSNEDVSLIYAQRLNHSIHRITDKQFYYNNELIEVGSTITSLITFDDYILLSTLNQFYIYNNRSLNTPIITSLGSQILFLTANEHGVCLVDINTISLYSFDGRQLSTVKFSSYVAPSLISPYPNSILWVDSGDNLMLLSQNVLKHSHAIIKLKLINDDYCVIVDTNKDAFVVSLERRTLLKLTNNVQDIYAYKQMIFCSNSTLLQVYYFPTGVFMDNELTNKAKYELELHHIHSIDQVQDCKVTITLNNGSVLHKRLPIDVPMLMLSIKDQDAWIRLCRYSNDQSHWALLALLSLSHSSLATTSVASAFLLDVPYTHFIQYISCLPQNIQPAYIALMLRRTKEAESILMQVGVEWAVRMLIELHDWDRALELAVKNKKAIDYVVGKRREWIERMNGIEKDKRFIQLNESWKFDKVEMKRIEMLGG